VPEDDRSRQPIDSYAISQDAEAKHDEITIEKGHAGESEVESAKNVLTSGLGWADRLEKNAVLSYAIFDGPPKAQVMAVHDAIEGSEKAVPAARSGPRHKMRTPQDDRSRQLIAAHAASQGTKVKVERASSSSESEEEGNNTVFMSQLGRTDHQDKNADLSHTISDRPSTALVSHSLEVRPSWNDSAVRGLSNPAETGSSTASNNQSASTSWPTRTNEANVRTVKPDVKVFDPTLFWSW